MQTFVVDDVQLTKNNFVTASAEEFWEKRLAPPALRWGGSGPRSRHSTKPKATVLHCSPGNYLTIDPINPLLGAVGLAYNCHHPLSLSPAAVWTAIAQGLSIWINENAKAMRKQFVDFEGKVKIEIEVPPNPDWNLTLSEFSEKISDYVGKKRDLFISDFSTATLHEKTASEVVLMYAMNEYFSYGMMTLCGFPRITLEGSVEDWEKIRDRVRTFSDFAARVSGEEREFLTTWVGVLLQTLDPMVESAKGNVDLNFWRSFYKENHQSGGPFATGHVINFFPYVNPGRGTWIKNLPDGWGTQPAAVDQGISTVGVEWNFLGVKRNVEFRAGLTGITMAEDNTLRPECGWAVVELLED